jgi:quercetin dioxygenase-like cupin family protein
MGGAPLSPGPAELSFKAKTVFGGRRKRPDEDRVKGQAMDALTSHRFNIDLDKLNWMRQVDFETDPARPVDTSIAVVGGDAATGRVDFFNKWEPGTYCPLHRHCGDTISVVLEGEHIVENFDGSRRTRPPGHYGVTPANEYHWELGGPEGSLLFFTMTSPDGRAFELMDREGNVIGELTVADLLAGKLLTL